MIGSRGAAALLAAVAVTALLTGCQPLTTGAAAGGPQTSKASEAPTTPNPGKASPTGRSKAGSSVTQQAKAKSAE